MRIAFLLMMFFIPSLYSYCQDASVMSSLRSKYTSVQYHPECGGWYFLSYQKGNSTLYGFADQKGNVIVSEALKYKLYKGFGEFYLLDQQAKDLHDQWISDKRQYDIDLQNYNRIKANYEAELSAYREKVKSAKKEAERRYENAREAAMKKAQAEAEEKQKQNQNNSNAFAAILSGISNGVSVAAAANSVKYEPFEQQVLAERSLTVAPSEPYNPKPTLPSEPSDGYYWKKASFLQPDKYSYIDYDKITGSVGYADVMCDGKYGLIDVCFNEIVPCTNTSKVMQSSYGQNKYIIRSGGAYGVIDEKAQTIVPCEYSSIKVDYERLIVKKDGKMGLLSLNGEEIMPCDYEELQNSNGFYLCKRNNLWGVYTSDFQELYPCQFQKINFAKINNKLVLHTQMRGLWGVVDFETGDNLLPNNFVSITETTLGGVNYFQTKGQNNLIGLYDVNGIVIIPAEFTSLKAVEIQNTPYIETTDASSCVGLFDVTGVSYIPSGKYKKYKRNGWYYEVSTSNGVGVCSAYGEELIPCKYSSLTYDSDSYLFIAKQDNKVGLLTVYGKELFPMVMTDDFVFSSRNNYIMTKGPGWAKVYGAIDFAGNEILPQKNKNSDIPKKVLKYEKKVNLESIKNEALVLANADVEHLSNAIDEEESKRSKFSFYAQNYVERVINDWQKRGEFEKIDSWKLRVNSDTRQQKVYSLTKDAQDAYIKEKQSHLKVDAPSIVGVYDPDHETYRIKSSYSEEDLLVKVSTDDAQEFKASFSSLKKVPTFFVENDGLGLAEYTFTMPNGHSYKYSNESSLVHTVANVDYSFDAIEIDGSASNMNHQKGKQTISTVNFSYGRSDIDVNIPKTGDIQEDVYAIIITNENYENEKKVEFAYNDGQAVKDYFVKTIGLPEKNVHFRPNASLNNMRFEINWMKQMAQETSGKAKFLLYYAGHGMPGDGQMDACLLPVDGTSSDFNSGYKLSELYETLSQMPSQNIMVFLDACFSGSSRSGEVMASTRGVALKTKIDEPKGNVIVFSATRDNETAHPYREKNHGLFTYYLLKNIQASQGSMDLGTLSDNVSSNVAQTALKEVNKPQHPTVTSSPSMTTTWRQLRMK